MLSSSALCPHEHVHVPTFRRSDVFTFCYNYTNMSQLKITRGIATPNALPAQSARACVCERERKGERARRKKRAGEKEKERG